MFKLILLVTVIVNFLAVSSFGDEGMWVYNNLPKAQLKQKYNFDITDAWANHLMKSSVRFNNGGSGSFVSSAGLVLTNHHVAADTLQKLSTEQNNYYETGFTAKTQAEEEKAPDLELNQLEQIVDVTTRVNSVVKPEMPPPEAAAARRAEISRIEKEFSVEAKALKGEVVTLYQGGQYHLYQYKKYTDVRLVFAPEFKIAFFGGDPDNFEFPRYDLDMAIFRVYENGAPAKLEHFLAWSKEGAKDGELTFVSGHPGSTRRMFTVAALEFLRDLQVPYVRDYLARLEIMYQQYSIKGKEQARRAKEDLFSVQNSRKVYLGRIKGLQDTAFFQSKQKGELALRTKVLASPDLKPLAGAWDKIAQAKKLHRKLFLKRSLLETGQAFNSELFQAARVLVRLGDENLLPNEKRLKEYQDANRPSLELALYASNPAQGKEDEALVYEDLEKAKLADSLSYLQQELGSNNAVVQLVLRGKDPVARATELVDQTLLKSISIRRFYAVGGKDAIESSYDPMIELARLVDSASRKIRKQVEEQIDEVEKQAYGQIAKAIFAVQGTSTYPDATFTLRLAYGQVKGYVDAGTQVPALTTMGGAFDHEKAHEAKDPWILPESWHKAKANLDLNTPFNFVSTTDIIGGNSGSPVVNQAGELVGLIFDGNIHSLTADYLYTDTLNRSVSVHSSSIMESLKKIYSAQALADELGK